MSVSIDSIPKLNPDASLDGVNMTPEDAFVLSRVNGHSTVEEIRQIVGFTADKLLPVFHKLLEWQLILITNPHDSGETDKKKDFGNNFQKRMREKYNVLKKQDHFRTLELDWNASSSSIDKQYFKLSKEFHPDRFFGQDIGPFKEMLDEVFNGIQQAYEILSNEQARKAHLKILRTPKSANQKSGNGYQPPKVTIPSNTKPEFSSSDSQFQMGQKEEARGNLQAALNFYKMARLMDKDNPEVSEALTRVKKAMKKNPLMDL